MPNIHCAGALLRAPTRQGVGQRLRHIGAVHERMLTSDQQHPLPSLSVSVCAAAALTLPIAHRTAESTCTSIGMGFLSRRSATAGQKKPVVSDDLAPPPELEMNMDDLWEQALAKVRPLGLPAPPRRSPPLRCVLAVLPCSASSCRVPSCQSSRTASASAASARGPAAVRIAVAAESVSMAWPVT